VFYLYLGYFVIPGLVLMMLVQTPGDPVGDPYVEQVAPGIEKPVQAGRSRHKETPGAVSGDD
jgi:hypothetical protein